MKKLKITIVILFILSILVSAFALVVLLGKQAEENKRVKAEQLLQKTETENKKLSTAYREVSEARDKIKMNLELEKKRANEIMSALEKEKKGKVKIEQNLKKANERLGRMSKEYQQLTKELGILQKKIQDLGVEKAKVVKASPGKLKAEIEIPPVVVRANANAPGRVLVVNRDFNFIVVDRGSGEGVAKGEFLSVKNGGQPIARVQVEKVYDHFSACGIIEESKSVKISEGDTVVKS